MEPFALVSDFSPQNKLLIITHVPEKISTKYKTTLQKTNMSTIVSLFIYYYYFFKETSRTTFVLLLTFPEL